ncbi:MAG: nickel pincer cofactor biosynthesis protein LarB [Polyangiaceae bacterium]
MDSDRLKALLESVRTGATDVPAALRELEHLPFADLGFARVDHHRAIRLGMPEVVLGEFKTPEQVAGIAQRLIDAGQNVLVTRVDADKAERTRQLCRELEFHPVARALTHSARPIPTRDTRPVAVVTAGTSDLPVAEEAAITLGMAGIPFERVFDVGVAGIHRIFGELPALARAPAVIVVAGMEGALPSVVGGLVRAPVIAVPTSVGYGAAWGGLTALFGMLTGCASGVSVVNIDNGFGAAMAVLRIVLANEDRSSG